MEKKSRQLGDLFFTFARIGAVTFGGGYSMLPFLQREVVERKKWATEDEILNYYAIGQCAPGIISVNTATFIGNKVSGIAGGIFAALGVVFPSLVIITLIAAFLTHFTDIEWIAHAFSGIRVCVCVLIFNAVIKLFKKSLVDIPTVCLFALILIFILLTNISPVIVILISALCGIAIQIIREKRGDTK